MRSKVVSAAALCLVSACADNIPVQPTTAALSAFSASVNLTADAESQVTVENPAIADIPAQLGLPEGEFIVVSAQLIYEHHAVSENSPTLILADNRTRLTVPQWVPNDPRRGGQRGLKWGYLRANVPTRVYDPSVPGSLRLATSAELEAHIVEAMAAWDARPCSDAPLTRLFPGQPGVPDIIQVGWQPNSWFVQNFPPNGAAVIGVTLTSVFVNNLVDKIPTDIDGNGRPDIAMQQIVYNGGKIWSDNGPLNTMDFFSIIAHETGHAFGLDHFGKVFVTKKDISFNEQGQPVIDVNDIKYAPKALMNAVYVMGRTDITGSDNGAFCQIWASQ